MKKNNDFNEITWFVHEYEKHERSKKWYVYAIIITTLLLIFSVFTGNFLFAIIIIAFAIITILNDGSHPQRVKIILSIDGVRVGRKFYDYDDLKNFAVVHKERMNISNLYFETKNFFNHRISIPLEDQDPIQIREYLVRFLKEDYERTDLSLSETFARIFKI
jgi:hypothetical protein